jgi:hypothetical protein
MPTHRQLEMMTEVVLVTMVLGGGGGAYSAITAPIWFIPPIIDMPPMPMRW